MDLSDLAVRFCHGSHRLLTPTTPVHSPETIRKPMVALVWLSIVIALFLISPDFRNELFDCVLKSASALRTILPSTLKRGGIPLFLQRSEGAKASDT
jgi:hypothetical protein